MKKIKILIVFGTRPEALKMAQLVIKLLSDMRFETKLCVTGQHREMLDQVLNIFNIKPNYDLNIMKNGQDLSDITSNIIQGLKNVFLNYKPDMVLVHGDTTTTLAATLSSYFHQIPVGHVEAGLRTGNIYSPWPEEGNRKITSTLAHLHFAPTEESKNNLRKEGVKNQDIIVTGNTVIDTLKHALLIIEKDKKLKKEIKNKFAYLKKDRKFILVTGHRRESFGNGFEEICKAIEKIAQTFQEIDIVYPVHMNPKVKNIVYEKLSNKKNIYLIEPQEYLPFVYLMNECYLILTDSGGVQEEAPTLGKPVLLMREITERPEAVIAGTVKIVGTNKNKIYESVQDLIINKEKYTIMSMLHNPYGDGMASNRIIEEILKYFKGGNNK